MVIANRIKKIWPSKIRSQLVLSIAIVHVLLMSLFIIELMERQKVFFLRLNHERAIGNSITLANVSTSSLLSYQLEGLQQIVLTYKNIPGLQYAMVINAEGTVLAHTENKFIGMKAIDDISKKIKNENKPQVLIENDSVIDIATPIVSHTNIMGWARVGLSQKTIQPNLWEIRKRGLFYILISIVLGSILALFIAKRLTKGLGKLVTAAEKIGGGDRETRAATSKTMELRQLGIAFNRMLDDISSNEKLLSLVLENLPVGVWILDEKGNVVSINPAGKELWKGGKYVALDDYKEYKAWSTDTGKQIESHEWGAFIAVTEGREVINQELEIECFDKTRKTILASAIPLRNASGNSIGALAINVDITERKFSETELRKINHDIGERVKELNCLYHISKVSNDISKTTENILQDCVAIIPKAYQYPHITCARITLYGNSFQSAGFYQSAWKQEKNILNGDVIIGKVEVFYRNEMREEYEGPFLKEERLLINSIADILGSSAERKRVEAAIKEEAEKYEAIIENTNEAILLISPERKILQLNKTAKDRLFNFFGKLPSPGADFNQFLYPDSEERFELLFNKAVSGEYAEVEFLRANNREENYWLRSRAYSVYDNSGKLIGVTILGEDISNRKKAENELKESEEKFRSLVEKTVVGVFILQDEKILYANPGFENICGFSKAELMNGMNFHQLIHEEDAVWVKENYELRISGKKTSDEYMLRAITKDGDIIYVDVIVSRIIYNNKPAVIGSVVDKTRLVEEEKRIGKAVTDAQENERMQIGMELHDNVKQLMAASLMNLDFIKKNINKKEECLETIMDLKGYIQQAITELRRLSHQLAPSVGEDTGSLIEKVEKLINDSKISDEVEIFVEIDEFQIPLNAEIQLVFYRIMQEQFTNIIKYSKASKVIISIKNKKEIIYLSIKDDGIGFDLNKRKEGIGLENIRRRVNGLNGNVKILSAPGEGCQVNVSVPVMFVD